MAKKPLKPPAVPPGDRKLFFDTLQSMVFNVGDPTTTELGERLGYSHQAVYKALTGPKMPSERITRAMAQEIDGDAESVLRLWRRGVAEERAAAAAASSDTPATATSRNSRVSKVSVKRVTSRSPRNPVPFGRDTSGSRSTVAPTADIATSDAQRLRPALSNREREVLLAWLESESKAAVADRLYISLGTVNTHLARIRSKYTAVGRTAPTKAELISRALQDGLLSLEDL